MNRELRHEECKAYIREVNVNAREERINAEYCLCVCDWRLHTNFIGVLPCTLRQSFCSHEKVDDFTTGVS